MSTKELIQNIKKLSYQERLYVIEKAIKIHQDKNIPLIPSM
jgi:hypothetical protein